MSTKAREHIEWEKNLYEKAVIERLDALGNRGDLQEPKILRDPRLRHLKAKVKQMNKRLLAISKSERQGEESARLKEERLERKRTEVKAKKRSSQEISARKKKKKEQAEALVNSQNEAKEED